MRALIEARLSGKVPGTRVPLTARSAGWKNIRRGVGMRRRGIGNPVLVARHIQVALSLPRNWMDDPGAPRARLMAAHSEAVERTAPSAEPAPQAGHAATTYR
jgi:hypothetical protein